MEVIKKILLHFQYEFNLNTILLFKRDIWFHIEGKKKNQSFITFFER